MATGPAKCRQDLDVGVGEAAGLVRGAQEANELSRGQQGDEDHRLRLGEKRDLLGEARIGGRLVAHIRATAPRVPQAAVFGAWHVAKRLPSLVAEPVHGQRRFHGARRLILQGDAHDGGSEKTRETLSQHAAKLRWLGDQRPIASNLVQLREVTRSGLGLLPAALQLVVERLEPEEGPHLENEGGGVHGLVEKIVGSGLVASTDRNGVAEGGHHDHRQGRPVCLPDSLAGLEPVHPGQADVQEDQIESSFGQRLEPLLGRLDARGRVAVQGEKVNQCLADHRIVFDDEHRGHGRRQCCPARTASQAARAILALAGGARDMHNG